MENGLITEVEYVRAIDGDTIEVKVERRFNIRLRGIDAVEHDAPMGQDAKACVDTALKNAKKIQVFIPSNDPKKLMDIQSFERLVADVYIDGKNLAELIRAEGLKKRT
jgi:endonuclease YncB( thermonuclease family)